MAANVSPSPTLSRARIPLAYGQARFIAGLRAAWHACTVLAAAPFDVIRAQHANAVKAGLVRKSLLESRNFERALGALERLSLGPLARRPESERPLERGRFRLVAKGSLEG